MKRLRDYSWQIFALILVIFPFIKLPFNHRSTAWDTFDVYTVNLTYFSDALSNFTLPLWNPFVLSGISFLANLFTYYLFGPIDLFFALAGTLVSPLAIAEINIIVGVLFIFFGNYRLLRQLGAKDIQAYIGAFSSSTVFAVPITGQIPMIYSFALLPWLLILIREKNEKYPVLKAIFLSAIFIKGYFYFNAIIIIGTGIYHLFENRKKLFSSKKNLYFILPISLFITLTAEATFHFIESYKMFAGDLIIEEPRIRPLVAAQQFFSGNLASTMKSLFVGGTWTNGLHLLSLVFPLFIISHFCNIQKSSRKQKGVFFSLIFISIIGLLCSANVQPFKKILGLLPIFSTHRWHFTNLYFSLWAMSLLMGLSIVTKFSKIILNMALALCFVCSMIFHFNYTGQMHLYSTRFHDGLAALKKRTKNTTNYNNLRKLNQKTEIHITDFNYFSNQMHLITPGPIFNENQPHKSSKNATNDQRFYWIQPKTIPLKSNEKPNEELFFHYDDFSWLAEKKPMSHGYNNTVSIFYWYQKEKSFNQTIVSPICSFSSVHKKNRSEFSKDNQLLDYYLSQIDPSGETILIDNAEPLAQMNCSKFELSNFEQTPNSLFFQTTSSKDGFAFITNTYAAGWKAYIDGKETAIYKTNLVFQGVVIPAGNHEIELRYRPMTLYFIAAWYILVGVLLLIELKSIKKRPSLITH